MDTLNICQAKSKRTGKACRNFVVSGKRVCHIHGGKSTGARTAEGRLRQKMASWKHGLRSKEAREEAKAFRAFIQGCRKELAEV